MEPNAEKADSRRSITINDSQTVDKDKLRPTRRLLRVIIVDYPTGICLFDKIWTWKGEPNTSGVAKVIVAFYKLSQSLGGKGGT